MRLLVIEDSDLLRDSLVQGLGEAGYEVDQAANGPQGLKLARSANYDLIVLDLMLPGLDGLDLLSQFRRDQERGGACVLVLTARDTAADRVRGLNAGADDYLIKPFEFAELLARVRTLLRRQECRRDPILRVDDLEINTASRTARRAGQEVALSAREYAILELLARSPGQIVSKGCILKQVYGEDSTESNVLDVYIALLRKKLDRPGLPRLLQTRRGQGFILGEERKGS